MSNLLVSFSISISILLSFSIMISISISLSFSIIFAVSFPFLFAFVFVNDVPTFGFFSISRVEFTPVCNRSIHVMSLILGSRLFHKFMMFNIFCHLSDCFFCVIRFSCLLAFLLLFLFVLWPQPTAYDCYAGG